jgi:hypothetical protein
MQINIRYTILKNFYLNQYKNLKNDVLFLLISLKYRYPNFNLANQLIIQFL